MIQVICMVSRTLFALDVGTTKICTLVAETYDQDTLRITGVGVVPSRGLQSGVVVDVDEATNAIVASVREAERISGVTIDRAVVGISGASIASVNSRGSVAVARVTRGVSQEDIERALESAQTIAIPYSYEILHAIPRGYTLDGQDGIQNPLGMYGHQLEVELHLVTAASSAIHNLVKCVEGAGVEVEALALESLASGEAVLTPEERESGVVLVDIGGGTTNVAIFINGSVWHSAVIPKGGYLVTKDLVTCLQMPFPAAEELKKRCGHADSSAVSEGELLEISGFGDQGHCTIPRLLVSQIIEARIEQIFSLVAKEIKQSGYSGLLPAGVVLCGGTAQLEGIRSVGKRILGMPVRLGIPQRIRGLVEEVSNPAYACSVGLLNWALLVGGERGEIRRSKEEHRMPWAERLKDWWSRILPG